MMEALSTLLMYGLVICAFMVWPAYELHGSFGFPIALAYASLSLTLLSVYWNTNTLIDELRRRKSGDKQ